MKEIFSFQRFTLLLRKHLQEEYRYYLLQAAGAFSIMFVLNLLTTLNSLNGPFDSKMHEVLFVAGFILGGSIFASLTYHSLQNNAKGIRFLQLPASSLEKLLVMFVVCQLIFAAGFLAIFYFNDWLMVTIYNTASKTPAGTPADRLPFYHAELLNLTTGSDQAMISAQESIVLFLVFSSIMHFCSLVFQKLSFIKTALCIVVIGGIIYWLNYTFLRSVIHETNMPGGKFFPDSIRLGEDDTIRGFVVLPDQWKDAIRIVLPGVLYLSFWTASYFKLKEKQI